MKQLFKLLQLGLQTTDVNSIDISEFASLTNEDWAAIKEMAVKQGVYAIVLDGINQLPLSCYNLPAKMKLEWIGETLQIEQRNRRQMAVMDEMAGKWVEKGLRVMVMKGQANGTMYPKPEHRNPGDIDCYLIKVSDERLAVREGCPAESADRRGHTESTDNTDITVSGYRIGNEVAREAGAKVDESWYKHSVINYKGEVFENHQYFVHTRDGKRGKRLEKELEDQLRVEGLEFREMPAASTVFMPPVQWTAMFLTYHACAHFVSEGLRLKQIVDWVMFLDKHQEDVDWDAFNAFCERNHLRRFADAMNAIAVNYLGINISNSEVVSGSPYADKIMHSALYDEDYVFGSGKGNWYNRYHLIRNMFHYRWKYEEVYQTSVWKQLWWYTTGFIFKTE